jgi:hypothetical protein
MQKPKRSKYNARKTMVDGIVFDSKREAGAWVKLAALARRGVIRNLRRQVTYTLQVNGVPVCRYIADFVFNEKHNDCDCVDEWREVVADSKGMRTRDYVLKAKLMKACHGIEIREL